MTAPAVRRSSRVADLALGARMSLGAGRAGWVRLALVAVGIGVGVAMLLLVASVPTVLDARAQRADARGVGVGVVAERGDDTLLTQVVRSGFRDLGIEGRLLEAEGTTAPLPPGVDRALAPGEVVLSPALERLMASAEGEALRGRWGDRVVGTIGPEGLTGPRELTFYLGADGLDDERAARIRSFGAGAPAGGGLDPALVLLGLVGMVVLLVPVVGFIGTAVRFGGEGRDRRLAALRLVGADAATTRRVAAGESLVGSLAGLAVGAALFVAVQQAVPSLVPPALTFFAEDLRPVPLLAGLLVVLVPVGSVLVTLSALRRVVVEPLGVVRRATVTRRRLWWRVVLPVAGLALMLPLLGGMDVSGPEQLMVGLGLMLLLLGVALLLPWLVDVVVRRLGTGPVAWDLAVRRLQQETGTAVRAVSAIVVSVAGLIGLHGLFAGITGELDADDEVVTGTYQAEIIDVGPGAERDWAALLAGTPGVAAVDVQLVVAAHDVATGERTHVDVATCPVLVRQVGPVGCTEGDVVVVTPPGSRAPEPGTAYVLGEPGSDASTWVLPPDAATVEPVADPTSPTPAGEGVDAWLFVTPTALGDAVAVPDYAPVHVALDPADPDAVDRLRTTVAQVDPTVYVAELEQSSLAGALTTVRQVLLAGTIALLVVVGASLLVNVAEQLRERRRPLAVLVAFGTRRRTLALSVLWQVAIPVTIGLAVAVATGATLAAVLQLGARVPVGLDWLGMASTAGSAGLVVLLTTAASLPLLAGLTRPAALHAE